MPAPAALSQVSVGDEKHIWVRDDKNVVHRFDLETGKYAACAEVGQPTHIDASEDGTLWHCTESNAHAFRFLSEAKKNEDIQVNAGVTSVRKVASVGFGTAHCLVQEQNKAQLYRYDSPYVFKTSRSYLSDNFSPIEQGLGNLYTIVREGGDFPDNPLHTFVVALDAHTGHEVARQKISGILNPAGKLVHYPGVVFDPINELVYVTVGTTPSDTAVNEVSSPGGGGCWH